MAACSWWPAARACPAPRCCAAAAALRGEAGLVRVAVPEGIQEQVAVGNPCYTTSAMPQESDGVLAMTDLASLLDLAANHDVVVLGPGLGKSAALPALIASLVKEIAQPLVLDADGLNALHGKTEVLHNAAGPRILTPHPGEFARLAGLDIPAVQANRRELAVRFAADHRVVLVLKGHGTVVSDGAAVYENTTGNPGMATGGTGDVLAGFLGALLGQGLAPFAAAQLGVYLHGRAGDLACVEKRRSRAHRQRLAAVLAPGDPGISADGWREVSRGTLGAQ